MIIFLDIDGVLHPDPATLDQAFCQRHLLWELLKARLGMLVVISSSWRTHHSLDEIIDFILAGGDAQLRCRFVGSTPVLPGANHEYRGRERECVQWLNESSFAGSSWLAIDDIAGNFAFGSPHVLLTDYRTGITSNDIKTLLSKIPP
jgi:hypothetical protein